jgi:hypothetical protein
MPESGACPEDDDAFEKTEDDQIVLDDSDALGDDAPEDDTLVKSMHRRKINEDLMATRSRVLADEMTMMLMQSLLYTFPRDFGSSGHEKTIKTLRRRGWRRVNFVSFPLFLFAST